MRRIIKMAYGFLLSISLGLSLVAQAQSNSKKQEASRTKTQTAKTDAILTVDQQTALYVLEQLFGAAKSFEDDQLKIKTQAEIADMLWQYDEPRARLQFEEVFHAISSTKLENRNDISSVSFTTLSPVLQLESDVLRLVARHDADFAEKLINSLAKDKKDGDAESQAGTDQSSRSKLYLQTAISIAGINPERAVQLAKVSLAGGIDPSIMTVLFVLRQKSPKLGDELYRAALAVARRDTQHLSLNITILASYALPEFAMAGLSSVSSAPSMDAAQIASPMAVEFLDFVYITFMQLSGIGQPGASAGTSPILVANQIDYLTGQRMLPLFIQYMPDKAAMFRTAVDSIARNLPQNEGVNAVNKMFQPASTDELLKQAEAESNPLQRDMLYLRAALSISGDDDADRALTLVSKIDNKDLRDGLDSLLRFQASSAFIKKNEIDLALRYAKGVTDIRQRAFLLGRIAHALVAKKNVRRATEILNDAEQMISKSDEGVDKAQALLIITEVKIRLDPAQGFESMEATVKAFNRADFNVEDKSKAIAPVGSAGLSIMLNNIFKLESPDFGSSFAALAKIDFNRSVQLAQVLKKKDRSVLAQLAACRGILVVGREKKI